MSTVLGSSPHQSQGLCVESDEVVVGKLSATYFTIK